jgi:type III pantothenate kinase
MILAIDIGNTTTMTGIFSGNKLIDYLRIGSRSQEKYGGLMAVDEIGLIVDKFVKSHGETDEAVDGVALCSVVPDLTPVYCEMASKYYSVKPWVLEHTADLGMNILYDDPGQVGPDRLANALAVKRIYGTPAIVVDLGTATTFDVINSDGDYVGGVIAPGVITSSAELFRRAARLFPVEVEKPEKYIGKNTADSMKSGIFYGSLGLIDYLVSQIISEMDEKDVKIIATGGHAEKFAPFSEYIQQVDQKLTLKGIMMAYERNV